MAEEAVDHDFSGRPVRRPRRERLAEWAKAAETDWPKSLSFQTLILDDGTELAEIGDTFYHLTPENAPDLTRPVDPELIPASLRDNQPLLE